MKMLPTILVSALCFFSTNAFAKILRPSDLSERELQQFFQGRTDNVIEFWQGDQFPVILKAKGDILESISAEPTTVEVKRSFYLKFENGLLLMSWDGVTFKSHKDLINGTLEAKASGSPATSNIELIFSAYIKP